MDQFQPDQQSRQQTLRAYCSTVIKGLFREVGYKLNAEFEVYITLWFYEENFGWKGYKGKMLEGEDNYIKVGTFFQTN